MGSFENAFRVHNEGPYGRRSLSLSHTHTHTRAADGLPCRYKQDVSSEQKQALLDVLRQHKHPNITPEIRRELVSSRSRDSEGGAGLDPALAFAAGLAGREEAGILDEED